MASDAKPAKVQAKAKKPRRSVGKSASSAAPVENSETQMALDMDANGNSPTTATVSKTRVKKTNKKTATVDLKAVTKKAKEIPLPPEESEPLLPPSKGQILLAIHNKNKYTEQLLSIYQEQLDVIGKKLTPDYQLMFDIMHYMNNYPDKFHHPRENVVFKTLIAKDKYSRDNVDTLILEHESRSQKGKAILALLKDLKKDDSGDLRRRLSFRSEDYLLLHRTHVDLEENKVIPRIHEVLNEEDWNAICDEMEITKDPLFGRTVERRYQALNTYIADRMEIAADEFTLAEFVGMGVIMESIGTVATTSNRIRTVVNKYGRHIYRSNAKSYKQLWKAKNRSKRDFISVPMDSMLDTYDCYTDALKEIGMILRDARKEIEEPYLTRIKLYNDVEQKI